MFQGEARSDDVQDVQRPHHGAATTERDQSPGAVSGAAEAVPGVEREAGKKPGRQAHRVVPGRLEVKAEQSGGYWCCYVSSADNGPSAWDSCPWSAAWRTVRYLLTRLEQAA